MAHETDVPFLGRIPLDPQIVQDSDGGTPYVLRQPESHAARVFGWVVERIMESSSRGSGETATLSTGATTGRDTGGDQ